jgi:hypothetical protein
MYPRNRFQAFKPVPEIHNKQSGTGIGKIQSDSKPLPVITNNNTNSIDNNIHNISKEDEKLLLERSFDKNKPLFKFKNISIYIDDIIIIGVIIILLSENSFRDNTFLLPILIYILLEGKE